MSVAGPTLFSSIFECLAGGPNGTAEGPGRFSCVRTLSEARGYPGRRHSSISSAASAMKGRPQVVWPILRRLEPRMGPETLFRMILATTKPGVRRTFVDVGANQGEWSKIAAKAGHRVIAFEPLPNNIRAFQRHVVSAYPSVRLVTQGVGSFARSVRMRGNTKGSRSGVASGTTVDVGATITSSCDGSRTRCVDVAITTLDTEVREPVFVMKMDIQGYETHALMGAQTLLLDRGVDILILEFDPRLQDLQGGSCLRILQMLHSAGYVLFENARLGFDTKFTKLDRMYKRNWGAPLGFQAFVAGLRKEAAYTDLVAVHADLVQPPGRYFA